MLINIGIAALGLLLLWLINIFIFLPVTIKFNGENKYTEKIVLTGNALLLNLIGLLLVLVWWYMFSAVKFVMILIYGIYVPFLTVKWLYCFTKTLANSLKTKLPLFFEWIVCFSCFIEFLGSLIPSYIILRYVFKMI